MAASTLLSLRKSDVVLGTFEPDAFLLSLRNDTELSLLHEYGYHRIPHIGVYGEFYSPCLPMVLISLPAVKEVMKEQLPPSVLQALYPAELPEPMEVACLPTSPPTTEVTVEEDSTLPPNGNKCEEDKENKLQSFCNDDSQKEGMNNATSTGASTSTSTSASTSTTTTTTTTSTSAASTTPMAPPSPSHSTESSYGCICCGENEAEQPGCLLTVLRCIFQAVRRLFWNSFELSRCLHCEGDDPSPSPQSDAMPRSAQDGLQEANENGPASQSDPAADSVALNIGSAQPQEGPSDRAASFQIESNTDFFIVFHPYPPPSPCQKFLCDNMDEINLVYHCWMYPEAPYSSDYTHTEQLLMGVFEAHGVKPVHQNLKDAGVSFGHLEERTVCIHDCRFSPENAQMQLTHETDVITFFSVAKNQEHQVVAYHVVCGSNEAESALRESLKCVQTLGDLLQVMQKEDIFQDCVKTVQRLVLPLAVVPEWSQ